MLAFSSVNLCTNWPGGVTAGDEGQVTVGHSVGAAVVGQGWQVGHVIGGQEGHVTVGQVGGGGRVVVGGHVGHVGGSGSV